MKEKLMEEVKDLVVEEGIEAIDSKPYTLIGVAVGVGLTTIGMVAYKKVLKPLGRKIKEKMAEKADSETESNDKVD